MEDLQQHIYDLVGRDTTINSRDAASILKVSHEDFISAMKPLVSRDIIKSVLQTTTKYNLTAEGLGYLENGSPEFQLFTALPEDGSGVKKSDLAISPKLVNLGVAKAMRSRWILAKKADKKDKNPAISRKPDVTLEAVTSAEEAFKQMLRAVEDGSIEAKQLKDLKRRKLIATSQIKTFSLTAGARYSQGLAPLEPELTLELLEKARTEGTALKVKPLNFNAKGIKPRGGSTHLLMDVRREFVEILVGMGFMQMPTDKWVESSFWNFDALFQPQQHPARDAHDTFFVAGPCARTRDIPEDYEEVVRTTHQTGGFGSLGYRYLWSGEEARKNLLRTHTTAVSARMLYGIGQRYQAELRKGKTPEEAFKPAKLFSIDRVFRNETLDATHLCEFNQVEGLVCDRGLTLAHLMGVIKQFFEALGMSDISFKPAYNPYTEPSMEIFAYHSGLGKEVEMGNSGIFRPEMLRPMGLPEDVSVIAWGLSLERPTMIKYGINNIRDLIGATSLELIQTAPLFRSDKLTTQVKHAPVDE